MTVRLYYDDPALLEFQARIVERRTMGDRHAVVLDRSAFYPTSGGQPHDTGMLGTARVVDVLVAEDGEVVHVLNKDVQEEVVAGAVDGLRRRDHRQHHTGQHILSRAFEDLLGARTIAFHLGATGADIDLDAAPPSDSALESVEARANDVVWEDRPVRIHYARTDEERSRFTLRKETGREGELRIIEIEGFDAAACGGTHVGATGEVGLIKVRKWEKVGSRARIHFLCGGRALADYGRKNRLVVDLARGFSVDEEEVAQAVERVGAEAALQRKEVRRLAQELADREAQALVARAETAGDIRIVVVRRQGETLEALSLLAVSLRGLSSTAAILGAVVGEGVKILMVRSDDVPLDLRPLLASALVPLDGKGGGRPESVQGAGRTAARLDEALSIAHRLLIEALSPPSES